MVNVFKSTIWVSVSAALAVSLFGTSLLAQEAPEVEAFIAGIDDYDKGDAVVVPPSVERRVAAPSNSLPGDAGGNDFVAGPPPAPAYVGSASQSSPNDSSPAVSAPAVHATQHEIPTATVPATVYFEDEYVLPSQPSCRWVAGVSVPIFDRNLDGDRLFSFNPGDPTQTLSSTDADSGSIGGIDVALSRRSSRGRGFEARYWGLYPADSTALLGGTPTSAITGLGQINDSGTSLADTFNAADYHSLTRSFSFNNAEFNLLRNGYARSPLGRSMTVEWLGGFRYLQFNESLEYAGVSAANPIIRSALNSSVENSLFGFQSGGRAEWHLLRRVSLSLGGKLGLFNNRAQTNIVATNQLADLSFRRPVITAGANAGTEFEFSDTKDDLSLLGEVDFGVVCQLTQRSRVRVGYRALGVSSIADAEQNIPADFGDTALLQSASTEGDLVLRGLYVGAEFAF